MSKYIASLVPDQILNMVARLKEATIDVGPQPVRFAKFTFLSWQSVLRLQKSKQIETSEETGVVECLILATDIAFEIWLVKSNSLRVNAKPVFNLGP